MIAVAPEEIPARWWKPQPPKLDQDGLTKAVRAREKALKEAAALTDPEERGKALAAVETLHPLIPGVSIRPHHFGITVKASIIRKAPRTMTTFPMRSPARSSSPRRRLRMRRTAVRLRATCCARLIP